MDNFDPETFAYNLVYGTADVIGETATIIIFGALILAYTLFNFWIIFKVFKAIIHFRIKQNTWKMDYQAKQTAKELHKLQRQSQQVERDNELFELLAKADEIIESPQKGAD